MKHKWTSALLAVLLALVLVPMAHIQAAGAVDEPETPDGETPTEEEEEPTRIDRSNVSVNGYGITIRNASLYEMDHITYGRRTLTGGSDYTAGGNATIVQIGLSRSFVNRLALGSHKLVIHFTNNTYAEATITVRGYTYRPPEFSEGSSDPIDTRSDEEREPITEDYSGRPTEGAPAADNDNRNPGTGR